jgi:hypothetical protein
MFGISKKQPNVNRQNANSFAQEHEQMHSSFAWASTEREWLACSCPIELAQSGFVSLIHAEPGSHVLPFRVQRKPWVTKSRRVGSTFRKSEGHRSFRQDHSCLLFVTKLESTFNSLMCIVTLCFQTRVVILDREGFSFIAEHSCGQLENFTVLDTDLDAKT